MYIREVPLKNQLMKMITAHEEDLFLIKTMIRRHVCQKGDIILAGDNNSGILRKRIGECVFASNLTTKTTIDDFFDVAL